MLNWNDIIHFTVKGNPKPDRRVEKTDEEWRELLTEEQYRITRLKGTERPGSGAYCTSYEPGIYSCICCNTPLFDSSIKFTSGTGWPSFTQPIKENAIKYEKDASHGMIRVEIMCNTCDSHLGHVFPDGPAPSGLRYCVNSLSIKLNEK
jgi:peptide-methionine (R)-S-oxide reductase